MNRRALLLVVALLAVVGAVAGGVWLYRLWNGPGGEGNHPVVVDEGAPVTPVSKAPSAAVCWPVVTARVSPGFVSG